MRTSVIIASIVVFFIGFILNSIPTLVNFPYPIGYDSINYYLPLIYQFNENGFDWNTLFPIYLLIVYFLSNILWIDPYLSFNLTNNLLYGILGVSVLLLFTNIFRISPYFSGWSSIFVLTQLSLLRVSWDLHRDILSLFLFNVTVLTIDFAYKHERSIIYRIKSYIMIFCFILISVFSDRMLPILLIFSSMIFALVKRYPYLFMVNSLFILLFVVYFVTTDNITFLSMKSNIIQTLFDPKFNGDSFTGMNMLVFFITLNGVSIPFFLIGFFKEFKRLNYLIIPSLISIIFSFSWLVVPNYEYLVPERWIIVSGIFISMFAAYGLYIVSRSAKPKPLRAILYYGCMTSFIIYGMAFLIAPHEIITNLPAAFNSYTGFVFPLTMSMNSMEFSQNHEVVKIIDWINRQTHSDSIVIGPLDWRGWFQLFLIHSHKYIFSETSLKQIEVQSSNSFKTTNNNDIYLSYKGKSVCVNDSQHYLDSHQIYVVKLDEQSNQQFYVKPSYGFGKLSVYNVTGMVCNE